MIRLLHLSDIHLTPEPGSLLRGVKTDASLQKIITRINQLEIMPDVAIITGDLVVNQSSQAYIRLRPMLAQLEIPTYVLPGNHDDTHEISHTLCGENISSPTMATFKDWHFIFVNTKYRDERYGQVGVDELTLLQKNLSATNNNPTIVAFHHPPVQQCPLPNCQLQNGGEVMDLLKKYPNVHGILAGHTHMAKESRDQHIRQFVAPSTFAQAVHGNWQGGELTQDFWDNHKFDTSKQGFRLLDLNPDGKIKSDVIWV